MPDDIVRASKVAQWGNSAAVRLPAAVLERAHINQDDQLELVARDGEIILRRKRPRVTLDDLLARYDPKKHRHELMLDGPPVGAETI